MRWNVKEKTILITGANSGLGRAVAMGLAERGARVVMASRSRKRGEKARRAIVGGTALALGTVALALLALAPVLLNLMDAVGIAPALISGGPETVAQLMIVFRTMGRTLLVLLEQFVVPLVSLGMCSLVMALALNSLWMGAVRRLYVKS